jgi:hypothetical protein
MNFLKERLTGVNVSQISSLSMGQKILVAVLLLLFILSGYNTFIKPESTSVPKTYNSQVEKPIEYKQESEPIIEEFTISGFDSSSDEVKEIVDILTENTEEKAFELGYRIKVSNNEHKKLIELMERDKEYLLEQWIKSYEHLTVNLIALDTVKLINEALNMK